jgi:hypothetical protein
MFWLVTPSVRDRFAIRPADVLACVAVACLAGLLHPLLARRWAPPRRRKAR